MSEGRSSTESANVSVPTQPTSSSGVAAAEPTDQSTLGAAADPLCTASHAESPTRMWPICTCRKMHMQDLHLARVHARALIVMDCDEKS